MIDSNAWSKKLRAGDRCRPRTQRSLPQQFLDDTLRFVERYARVEKIVVGGVEVHYSPASLAVDLSPDGDPISQGEALAEAERARLELPAGPVLELQRLIEAQGIKVAPRLFPASEYAGGFFFDSQMGPCILLHAGLSESESLYALAHQYAHFLADFDPYITTLCGLPGTAAIEDSVEARAHATALAFLMPRSDLELYRDALRGQEGPSAPRHAAKLGAPAGRVVSAEFLQHLRVYFDLDGEIILWRLLELGWIDATGLRRLLETNAEVAKIVRTPPHEVFPGQMLLPDRFVRLVASAFGSGRIDLEDAAGYFDTDTDGAERILGQFEYEDNPQAAKGSSQ